MIGRELAFDETLPKVARFYSRVLGAPIVGLRIRWRWVADFLPDRAERVLDAGCGRGVIARAIAHQLPAAQLDAMDIDAERQKINQRIAQAMSLENCHFMVQDLSALDIQERYDLVVSVDNLEHIDDDRDAIRRLFNALVPGGRFLVHVPHYYRRWPVLARKENFDVPGHYRPGYHMPELRERLEQAGFEIETIQFSYGFLENLINNLSYAITGARERNKGLYALLFPLMNFVSWLGHGGRPSFGAGVIATAVRPEQVGRRKSREPDPTSEEDD